MKITVVGSGYVGLSNALLLAQKHTVTVLDIIPEKVSNLNDKILPIHEEAMSKFLRESELDLYATTDKFKAYEDSDIVIIATPTDYNPETKFFNTSSVELVAKEALEVNPKVQIVIKSTVPVGFTSKLSKQLLTDNILFSPEFLREGKALIDNQYPSRIIVGVDSESFIDDAKKFSELLVEMSSNSDVPVLIMKTKEAEAVKLFSNSYLALRISYFNEIDSFAYYNDLNPKDIILGMSHDPRIGNHYNNPSFGYGGYCLPKDTKQLLATYEDIPQNMITAIVDSNHTRKEFIIQSILDKNPEVVGIYRLIMKEGSDNFRSSAIHDIIKGLIRNNITVMIYEPTIEVSAYEGLLVVKDFEEFCKASDLIIANRVTSELDQYHDKVFSRDLFHQD